MLSIANFFGKSPFAPFQTHINKVASCVGELPSLFQAVLAQDLIAIEKISKKISQLEHDADLTKNDIRNHLPKSLFLPLDRESLFDLLRMQDSIADQAEKIGNRCSLRTVEILPEMREEFSLFCEKNMEIFSMAHKVIQELEDLLESSFGGIEAEKVKQMIDQIAFKKYEADILQNNILKQLYQKGENLPFPAFHLCQILIEEIGCVAKLSEELGHRVRMVLELN